MDGVQALFCLTGHRRLSRMECVNESHECPLRLCRGTSFVLSVLRSSRPYHNQRVVCLMFCNMWTYDEDELDWNSTSV